MMLALFLVVATSTYLALVEVVKRRVVQRLTVHTPESV